MKKKIILVGLFVISLFLISTTVVCLDTTKHDPIDDVIYIEEFNFDFDLEDFDYTIYLKELKDTEYIYTSDHPQIDINKIIINEVEENTYFTIEVEKVQLIYPTIGSNGFILAVIVEGNDDIFVAASLKYLLYSVNKYGYVSEAFKENVTIDDFEDFELSIFNGKMSFSIPTEDLPDSIKDIYIILGEATISYVDLKEFSFEIDDIYGDIYPNSLYKENTDIPVDDEDTKDEETNDTSEEPNTEINPFTIGLFVVIGIVGLIAIPPIFKKK